MAKNGRRTKTAERIADEWTREADGRIDAFFGADSRAGRADALRGLLTAMMGFGAESGDVPMPPRPGLPARADLLGSREGVRAVFVPLASSGAASLGIGRAEATSAASALAEQLGDDLLLAMLSADGATLHLVRPDGVASDRIVLRRIPFGRSEREGEAREGSRRLRAFGAGGGVRRDRPSMPRSAPTSRPGCEATRAATGARLRGSGTCRRSMYRSAGTVTDTAATGRSSTCRRRRSGKTPPAAPSNRTA